MITHNEYLSVRRLCLAHFCWCLCDLVTLHFDILTFKVEIWRLYENVFHFISHLHDFFLLLFAGNLTR